MRQPLAARTVAIVVAAAALAVSGLLIARAGSGPRPRFAAPASAPVVRARRDDRIELAGSGSALPVIRVLAARFRQDHPGIAVVVHDSIGSGGGLAALADGAIDFALTSRPLRDSEREGVNVLTFARAAVVVAAHADVPDRELSSQALLDLYAGARDRWSDGSRVVVIQRERGDSGHGAIAALLPRFAEINDAAWRGRRFPVAYSDVAMEDELARTPGAVGIAELGSISLRQLPLRVFAIDGVEPSVAAVAAGRYRFVKDLSLVWRGEPSAAMAAFVDLVRSEAGQALVRDSGYVPLGGGGR